MKIFNTKQEATAELGEGQKIDKTAFVQRVWLGNRHAYGIRVGHDLWYAGKNLKPIQAKVAEDPEKK